MDEGEIENENDITFKSLYSSILSEKSLKNHLKIVFQSLYASVLTEKLIKFFQNNIEKSSSVFQRKLKQ